MCSHASSAAAITINTGFSQQKADSALTLKRVQEWFQIFMFRQKVIETMLKEYFHYTYFLAVQTNKTSLDHKSQEEQRGSHTEDGPDTCNSQGVAARTWRNEKQDVPLTHPVWPWRWSPPPSTVEKTHNKPNLYTKPPEHRGAWEQNKAKRRVNIRLTSCRWPGLGVGLVSKITLTLVALWTFKCFKLTVQVPFTHTHE